MPGTGRPPTRRNPPPEEPREGALGGVGRPISDRDFNALRDLIYRLSGINLTKEKKALLVGRLNRRLKALALPSFGAYAEYLAERDDGSEAVRMLDSICTNETQFFRESQQFDFLDETVYPAWERQAAAGQRSRHVKVWSAACSTGEEPYSLAMSLLARFPTPSGWSVDILATDLSTTALTRAIQGLWSVEKSRDIPRRHLSRFMLKGSGTREGLMAVGSEVRSVVRFQRFNLNGRESLQERDFDLIFCRNVIIYFDAATKVKVVERLLGHLGPSGYLFLGHAESLHNLATPVRRCIPAVYALGGGVAGGARAGGGSR